MNRCVIHPDRVARVDATGILVCDECHARYVVERRREQEFRKRVFYQQLIKASVNHEETALR